MAEITKVGVPSLTTLTPPPSNQQAGLVAGEALVAGDAVYVKAADNKVWKATGAAATAPARVRGFAWFSADVGEAVTIVWDLTFRYGGSLSPGADVYLSGTVAGGLADAPSTGGLASIGWIVDDTRIHLDRNRA